ncbi:hypothetical protein WR00_06155 [Escherichia coli]|nr:hypothetical protein WR00_06155 [Escherichia coli]
MTTLAFMRRWNPEDTFAKFKMEQETGFIFQTLSTQPKKNASARAVREEVVAIAGTIKKNPRVLVTQAADRSWHLIKK